MKKLLLLLLLPVCLCAQTIRPTRVSQIQWTELTTAQEAGMTLAEGSEWFNTDLNCFRLRLASSTVCLLTGVGATDAIVKTPVGNQTITGPFNLTLDGNFLLTTTGQDLCSSSVRCDAFLEDLQVAQVNNVIHVDGNKYACTAAGIASAITDVGTGVVDVKGCEGTTTISSNLTVSPDVQLLIGAGTLSLTSSNQILMKNGSSIDGIGPASIIRAADSASLSTLIKNADATNANIVVRNLRVDGNQANQVSPPGTGGLITFTDVTNFRIEDVEAINGANDGLDAVNVGSSGVITLCKVSAITRTGIKIATAKDVVVSHCDVTATQNAVEITSGSIGITVGPGVVAHDAGFDGFAVSFADALNSTQIQFIGNIARDNTLSGFNVNYTAATGTVLTEILFSGNLSFGNTNHGFVLASSDGNTFTGNVACENGRHGFSLQGSSDNTFTGNVACNNANITANSDGFNLADDSGPEVSTGNVFSGNRAFDSQGVKTQQYGIESTGGTENTVLTGNDLGGNLTGRHNLVDSAKFVLDNINSLSATDSLNFDFSGAGITCQTINLTVTGAAVGDAVYLGLPTTLQLAGVTWVAWVSATDTVQVQGCDVDSSNPNPVAATVRADVWQH